MLVACQHATKIGILRDFLATSFGNPQRCLDLLFVAHYPKDPWIRPYGLIAWNQLLWPCDSSQIRLYGLKSESQSEIH